MGPGVIQAWAVYKGTGFLKTHTEGLFCVNLAGNLALPKTSQIGVARCGEKLVWASCLESAVLLLQKETAEGQLVEAGDEEGQGNKAELTPVHINLGKRSDSSLFTNSSALLKFLKAKFREKYYELEVLLIKNFLEQ